MGFQLMKQANFVKFLENKQFDPKIFTASRTWAGLPKDESNLSFYQGKGSNRATITWKTWTEAAFKAWEAFKGR